ncbi:MAG: DUF368 domain-containing protein [Flavobacteriales bacterium]
MKWPWSVTAKGFAMGVADLVPGVSGGTVAFITGIYDPLMNSLSAISGQGFTALKKGEVIEAWNAVNGRFLVALGIGIILAITTLASKLHWLLEHEPVLLRSFFMGLVAMSVPLVGKHVGRWGTDAWVWAAVGCAVAGFVTSLPPLVQSNHPLLMMTSGAIAICAMLLPGISGSLLLLILGAYAPLLRAVDNKDLTMIGAFGTGALFGLLTFSKIVKWLLASRRRPTLAVLTGFLVGSLQALWPWKAQIKPLYTHSDGRVEWMLENILPSEVNADLVAPIGLAIVGAGLVSGLQRWGDAQRSPEAT